MQFKKDKKRTVKKKHRFDETSNEVIKITGKENFRINVFCVVLDKFNAELVRRSSSYKDVCVRFDFLTNVLVCNFDKVTISEKTREKLKTLIEQYPNDIEESFTNECFHLCDHFFLNLAKKEMPKYFVRCCTQIISYIYIQT
jgi:hypothetical protein